MRRILTLFVMMCLYSMALLADPVISFSSKGKPTGWPDLVATVDNVPITSGASAAQSAELKIVAPKVPYYHVEWYVNGELSKPADSYVLQWVVSGDCTVEARYVENFKMIFKDTPFVKYADENGVIIRPSNHYHHKYEKQRAFGYSVQSWTGSDGKNYLPDNIVTDTIDQALTLNEDSLEADQGVTGLQFKENTSEKKEGCKVYTVTIPGETVKANAGKTITLTYTAVLNDKAVIDGAGSPNTVRLNYNVDNAIHVNIQSEDHTVVTKTHQGGKDKPEPDPDKPEPDPDKPTPDPDKPNQDPDKPMPNPDHPDNPSKVPQTGQLWWPVIALGCAGAALLAVGIFKKKGK